MQTFDQALYALYRDQKIELEEALRKADSRDGLALKIRLAEGGGEPGRLGSSDPYDTSAF